MTTDPGLPNLPEDWTTGDTFRARDINDIAERINDVEDDNADDVEPAALAAGLAGKVDKVSGGLKVYGTNGAGEQAPWDAQETAAPYTIPYRDGEGALHAADAVGDDELVTMAQLKGRQPRFLTGTVATAAATAAKVVTLDAPSAAYVPAAGDFAAITFTLGNTVTTPTLAVNGQPAKGIIAGGGSSSAANTAIAAGTPVLMQFDGTNYRMHTANVGQIATLAASEVDAGTSTSTRSMTGQMGAYIRGPLLNARTVAGTETVVIAAGSITQVNGTTVGGVALAVGDKFVVLGAPAASGVLTGTVASTQPANGLYQVTAVGTNLTVARAAEMAGTNSPLGKAIRITEGGGYGPGVNTIVTVSAPVTGAFTYGTTALAIGDYFLGWGATSQRLQNYVTAVPASATATASRAGLYATDGAYLYISTAVNTWRRVAIAAW